MKLLVLLALAAVLSGCQSLQDRAPSTPVVKTISVNDANLTYLEQGTGVAVVFVHGAFEDHRIWEAQREVVAKRYRFIALDLRYFGSAPWTDDGSKFSQATHVADLAAFIRELNAGPVHLVGRSYGASVAVATALQHPELVRGLFPYEPAMASVLTDPSEQKIVAEDRKGIAAVGAAVKAGNNAEATKQFFDFVNNLPGGFDSLPSASRAVHLDNARTIPLQLRAPRPTPITCTQLGQIKAPVTFTRGELTRLSFRVYVEAAYRCVAGSQLIVLQGATHYGPREAPRAYNQALLRFLAQN